MKRLVIIGAGNVGGFLSYNIKDFGGYELLGFLDDDDRKHNKIIYSHKVLGPISAVKFLSEAGPLSVAVGISSPVAKAAIISKISELENIDFPNFISPQVWLSKSVTLGKGIILYPGVAINYETLIGNFAIINMNCAIGHNCHIGDYSALAPGVNLAGFTSLDEKVTMGIGASTKQNVKIGAGSIIGGQSMLVKDVEAGTTVIGLPGKKLR